MITKQQSVEYLMSTIVNYTGSHLAEHLDDVSHDVITDHLRGERLTSHGLRELVSHLITNSPDAFLLVDDSVQDKRDFRFIEFVKRPSSYLDPIDGMPERFQNGVSVKLKEVPFQVQVFKLVAPDGDTPALHQAQRGACVDWVITNCSAETLTALPAQDANDVRWHDSRKNCIAALNN